MLPVDLAYAFHRRNPPRDVVEIHGLRISQALGPEVQLPGMQVKVRLIRGCSLYGTEKVMRSERNAKFQTFFEDVLNHGVVLTFMSVKILVNVGSVPKAMCQHLGSRLRT